MSLIHCPHCRSQLDSTGMAPGMAFACPICGKQLPPLPPPINPARIARQKQPRNPIKTMLLISTWLWMLSPTFAAAFTALAIYRANPTAPEITTFTILVGTAFLMVPITLVYAVVATCLGVIYFCTKDQ